MGFLVESDQYPTLTSDSSIVLFKERVRRVVCYLVSEAVGDWYHLAVGKLACMPTLRCNAALRSHSGESACR